MNYQVLYHNAIKIDDIYIDPYKISSNELAKYIFITHSHYDHLSIEDIKNIITDETVIICPADCLNAFLDNNFVNEIILVEPNNEYTLSDLSFETTYSYNKDKDYHKKEDNWVGYIINYQNVKYYIAGDTDHLEELDNITCDVAFVPIGGTYTMTKEEAAQLVNKIKPATAIPTHYNSIVGNEKDAEDFKNLVDKDIKVEIF